ncbi:DUF3833 family protein [Rhizobium herbae]|uniref:DUF3833 family protein n=1 Tax=Rhizobium herbae TaxID=508661 RepID=A0ABS4ETR2_9HYPH|nr:DUF3833 family protein [Rhizobium herbae]MBP1861324.1 hypothetical protein [Rhizobium herbae]
MTRILFSLAVLGLLSPAPPASAADTMMETFFRGKTTATGSFSAINGVKRQFDVVLTGRVRGDTLTVREDFVYSGGERDRKTWRFVRTGPATYSGTREDVVGTTTLRVDGNTARFNYLVDLDPGPGKNIVRFFDKMVLADDGRTIANTASVWKYIFPVARVTVDFRR